MGVGRDVEDSGGYVDWSIAERAHYRYIANNQQRRDCKTRRHVSKLHTVSRKISQGWVRGPAWQNACGDEERDI
jgi:hypothetical protein